MTLDEPKKDEIGFNVNGIDVLMEDFVQHYADGNTVDYITDPRRAGFTIVKAGEGGGCGDSCGGSCH